MILLAVSAEFGRLNFGLFVHLNCFDVDQRVWRLIHLPALVSEQAELLFFACTLDSTTADLIWLDSRINTGQCECWVEYLQLLLSKITGEGLW